MAAAPIGGSELLSFAASLIVVVGVIVVLGWLYSRSKLLGGGSNDAINIIANRAVGSKERLMVVEVGGTQLLVGMTASNVNTLHVFDAPFVETSKVTEATGFARRLKSALKEIRQ